MRCLEVGLGVSIVLFYNTNIASYILFKVTWPDVLTLNKKLTDSHNDCWLVEYKHLNNDRKL